MRIAVDFGHGTGQDRGADGYLNEERVIREYGPLIIAGLQKLGHTVINITPTQSGLSLGQSLAYRVNVANNAGVDLVVSCHVNAYEEDKARGCEVEYISPNGKIYADRICSELAALGFTNRGSQQRSNLYVLKYTNAVAVLVEPFFCDTKADCDLYNPKKIANAIIKGITGQDVYVDAPKTTEQSNVPSIDHVIPQQEGIQSVFGGFGYIQALPNRGRLDIHLDKYNYITIQDDAKEGNHITLVTRTKGSKELI